MNLLLNLSLLTALTLPLAAQRQDPEPVQSEPTTAPSDQDSGPRVDPTPASLFAVELKVDHYLRLATMTSNDQLPFFCFMVAATKPSILDIPGIGGLLEYEAIVATALCNDGRMVLDLGKGGWGFDVYLQGVAVSELGVAMTSVEVVRDEAPEAK